jgi:hypothetical protein
MITKSMTKNQFLKRGLIFYPKSLLSWSFFSVSLAYLIYSFIAINNRSHSVSDALINFLLQVVLTWSAYTTIALFFYFFEKGK